MKKLLFVLLLALQSGNVNASCTYGASGGDPIPSKSKSAPTFNTEGPSPVVTASNCTSGDPRYVLESERWILGPLIGGIPIGGNSHSVEIPRDFYGNFDVTHIAQYCYRQNTDPNAPQCTSIMDGMSVKLVQRPLYDCGPNGNSSGTTCTSQHPSMFPNGEPSGIKCHALACGKPVNVASGLLWHENVDFILAGRTPQTAIPLVRQYLANATLYPGGFGPNWHFNFETKFLFQSNIWVDENGGPWQFTGDNSVPSLNAKIFRFPDHIELLKKDRTRLFFSINVAGVPLGRLYKITEPHGEAVNLTYENGKLISASTGLAGTVLYVWNSAGDRIVRVDRVRDNLSYTYSYNAQGRLESVTDFAGKSYHYTYVNDRPNTYAANLLSTITDPLNRVTRFTYYDDGRAYQQFEPGGGVRTFSYGKNETTLVEIDGATTKFYFDEEFHDKLTVLPDGSRIRTKWSAGKVAETSSDFGGTTKMGYDVNGNLTSIKLPEFGSAIQTTYDSTFNVPTHVQPIVGAATDFTLDSNNGDILEIHRGGLSLSMTRDAYGNLASVNNGRAIYSYERDANGKLTNVFDLHNPETRTIDSRGRVSVKSFASGRTLNFTYDDYDRVIAIVDNAGPSQTFVYDAMGRRTQQTRSVGGTSEPTTYQFDDHDRILAVTDALNRTTTFQYDPVHILTNPQSVTDPAGRVTRFEYDKRQRLVKKTEANGAVTRFTFDQRDNLTSVTDANGGLTTYAYDLNDRKLREMRQSVAGSSAAQRVTDYFYDSADHLVREITRSATGGQDRTVVYEYDPLDRMVHKVVQREGSTGAIVEDESLFTFENQLDASLMKTAVNGVASLGFTNEAAPPFSLTGFGVAASQSGNPLGLIEGNFSITRDVTGEIASVSKDGAPLFTRNFDPAGRVTSIGTPSGFSTVIGYDGFGRKTSVVHSSGESGSFTWDLLNRITNVSWAGSIPINEQVTYDLAGNPTQIAREGGGAYTVAFDAVDQLVSSTGLENSSYVYDLLGNRLQDSANGAGSFVGNFLTSNGTSNFLADPDGFGDVVRETTGSLMKSYAYRADGLLNAVQVGATQTAYYFDALGRRMAKIFNVGGQTFSQSYVYLGKDPQLLLGKAGDGTITTYVDGNGTGDHLAEVKNGVGRAYLTDHLGSVVSSSAAGVNHRFGLFGQPTATVSVSANSSPVDYAFGGYEFDAESGNYHTHFRQYSPGIGRWLSQDPIGIVAGNNYYAYLKNASQKETDPSGQGAGLALLCLAAHGVVGAADSAAKVRQYEAHVKDLDKLMADTQSKIDETISKAGGITNICKADAEYLDKLNALQRSYEKEILDYTAKIGNESLIYSFAFHGTDKWAATCLAALFIGPL